jgi:hypothetical protein
MVFLSADGAREECDSGCDRDNLFAELVIYGNEILYFYLCKKQYANYLRKYDF